MSPHSRCTQNKVKQSKYEKIKVALIREVTALKSVTSQISKSLRYDCYIVVKLNCFLYCCY